MTYFVYILKIVYYFAFVFIAYDIAKRNYRKEDKFPILLICTLCIFYGIYAIMCGKEPYASDRKNFAFRFSEARLANLVKQESLGLYVLEGILHFVTYEPKVLFFTVSYIYMFATFMAYRKCKYANPYTLLFLLITPYPTYGYYMLKQCLAMCFVSLCISNMENNKISSIIFLIIAILFHEAAWIAIPIFILSKFLNNSVLKVTIYLMIIIIILTFSVANAYFVNFAVKLVPSLGEQLQYYINPTDGSINKSNTIITIFKGIPFYTIFLFGYLDRKKLRENIGNYDIYMFFTFMISITTILSGYMYWLFRFGLLFYFPASILAYKVYENIEQKNLKICYLLLTYAFSLFLSIRLWFQYYFIYGGL